MIQPSLFCLVCFAPGSVNRSPLNGLPRDVVICEDCKEAVKRRQVGISRRPDGTLSVIDGRKGAA